MRKALVVGIDYYRQLDGLHGCVNDAQAVREVLERHADETVNFDIKLLLGISSSVTVSRTDLKDSIKELFEGDSDIALLYFAGHGFVETAGGYILASDSSRGDEGVSLRDIVTYANKSKAKNKVIILDSCYSGAAGSSVQNSGYCEISEGLTILTASTEAQYASEENGHGVFTNLLVDALNGGAANLVGDITPGSIYAHIDQSLGPWEQRPVFKTNVKAFVSLRRVIPPLPIAELQRIVEFFPKEGSEFPLDPSFEPRDEGRTPEMPSPNPVNTATFAILQKYNRVNLLVPIDAPHMWNAAMESKSCKLTLLGQHYRRLVLNKRI